MPENQGSGQMTRSQFLAAMTAHGVVLSNTMEGQPLLYAAVLALAAKMRAADDAAGARIAVLEVRQREADGRLETSFGGP